MIGEPEFEEFVKVRIIKDGRTGDIVDKTWRPDLNCFLYIVEYDEKKSYKIEDIIGTFKYDELELINEK